MGCHGAGEWTPDGNLKIIDRKKNLVKLKGGEYVALEFMENKYGNSEFVDALAGGLMVYAGGDVDRSVAFMQCNKKALLDWAKGVGIDMPFEALIKVILALAPGPKSRPAPCPLPQLKLSAPAASAGLCPCPERSPDAWACHLQDPRARRAVLDDLNAVGKKSKLCDLEKLLNVTLLNGAMGDGPEAWTPVNGGLTATNKLNRKTAERLIGTKVMEAGKVDARLDWMKGLK